MWVFDHDPDAQWNWPSGRTETIECPECNGEGGHWHHEDGGVKLPKAEYAKLPEDVKEYYMFWECEFCNGKGEIEP